MKRRLSIAAGVLHRPRVVPLDEPTVGVDPQSRERICEMLAELRRDRVVQAFTFLLPIAFFSIFALVFGARGGCGSEVRWPQVLVLSLLAGAFMLAARLLARRWEAA